MASFLVVDDNPLVQRAMTALLRRYGVCHSAATATDAEHHITSGIPWDGFVIDIGLEDGCGLDVLAAARRTHGQAPAVVLSGNLDRLAVNRAAALNARFVCKPCGASELAPFLADVLVRTTGDRMLAATERARHRWGLSPREVEIIQATLCRRSRAEYVEATTMSENTFKTHVRRLLQKAKYDNLASLAIDLLNDN
jgi:DNA-binding NarL/FixJ family response regulator